MPEHDLERLVWVPGQMRWHTHTCPKCGTSWRHIAPIPMTARKNIEIHTCHKCGEAVYTFELDPVCPPLLWGIFLGIGLVWLLS